MGYDIQVKTLAPQPVVSMRGACRPEDVARTLSAFLPATFEYVLDHGVRPAGPPFTRFSTRSHDHVEFEGGCPVPHAIEGKGEIHAGELPGGEVASTVHVGPYDGLSEAAAALHAWAEEQGRQPAGPPWESYLSDPGDEIDPFQWRTEVLLPLA